MEWRLLLVSYIKRVHVRLPKLDAGCFLQTPGGPKLGLGHRLVHGKYSASAGWAEQKRVHVNMNTRGPEEKSHGKCLGWLRTNTEHVGTAGMLGKQHLEGHVRLSHNRRNDAR